VNGMEFETVEVQENGSGEWLVLVLVNGMVLEFETVEVQKRCIIVRISMNTRTTSFIHFCAVSN